MNTIQISSLCYVALCSIVNFVMFGTDKRAASKNAWRTPESTLLTIGFIGGAIGGLAGMCVFHHKTQKLKFKLLMPLFAVLNIAAVIAIFIWL